MDGQRQRRRGPDRTDNRGGRCAGGAGSGTTELAWFKSSYSGSQGDDCVEVALAEQAVHVRDSKDLTRPAFAVGREGWGAFVGFVSEH